MCGCVSSASLERSLSSTQKRAESEKYEMRKSVIGSQAVSNIYLKAVTNQGESQNELTRSMDSD